MKQLDSTKRALDRVLTVLSIGLFMILVLVVFWQVFSRQILDSPSQWSETLSRYLFVWVGLLGATLVFGERGHLAIDVGVRLLPKVPQKVMGIFVQLIVIAFAAFVLLWGGYRATMNAWSQNLSGLPTAVGPWYLVMPISGVLIIFYSIYAMLKIITNADEPFGGDDQEALDALENFDSQDALARMKTEPDLDSAEAIEELEADDPGDADEPDTKEGGK